MSATHGDGVSPIADLTALLRTMNPVLVPGTFVFTSVPHGAAIDPADILASVRETEGLSLVMHESTARKHGLPALFRCAWITLTVHSALHAVGLTAACAVSLRDAGIACNVVAGAYHDHLFVPAGAAATAMEVLGRLQVGGEEG